jgi:opacity protein-like surface antigen
MKRFARVATLCVLSTLSAAAAAHAQATQTTTAPGATGADARLYAEVHGGPTLGHKSDTFVGGEVGLRLIEGLDVLIEGGHMGNVGTSKLDADAALIAGFLGGTVSSTAFVVNYANFGVRYRLSLFPMAHPYVLFGAGLAKVTTEATFAVNGTVIDPAQFGVQLGGDLSGSNNKTMIVAGGGVNVPFMGRFFADLGYRYGHILPKTENVETDKGIKTQRVVLGVGVRF